MNKYPQEYSVKLVHTFDHEKIIGVEKLGKNLIICTERGVYSYPHKLWRNKGKFDREIK